MHGNHSHTHQLEAPMTDGKTIRWARHYDLWVKLMTLGGERRLRNQTIQLAAIPQGATVLDVGCGTGTLTLLAKAQAGQQGKVYGIDAAPEMITVAKEKAMQQKRDVNYQTGVIEALPFPDGTFDIVLSSLMFHHLTPELKQRGLKEMYRVLKPGGRVFIVDMIRPEGWHGLAIITMIHRDMASDVREIIPQMETIGFANTQSGHTVWRSLGYVQGSR